MSWLLDWQARRINQKAFHQVFTIRGPSYNQQWKYNLDINYAFYSAPLGRNYNQRIPRWAQGSLHHPNISPLPQTFLQRMILCHFLLTWARARNVIFPETDCSWPMFSEAASLPFLFPLPVVCVNSLLSRTQPPPSHPDTGQGSPGWCQVCPALDLAPHTILDRFKLDFLCMKLRSRKWTIFIFWWFF